MAPNFSSRPVICKCAIVVLGIVVLGVGLHSHFRSAWLRIDRTGINIHKICDLGSIMLPGFGTIRFENEANCPDIAMERYFVSMIIICFILSVLNLVAIFFVDANSKIVKTIDILYHGIAAVFLIIAGIVHIVSAVQIKELGFQANIFFRRLEIDFRHGEKVAAGALTILQALLYGITAFFIGTS